MRFAWILAALAAVTAPPDLRVTVTPSSPDTGTMHYSERMTLSIGDAKPLVIERELTPIPGPHFPTSNNRFLLLGWSSTGAGMESLHAMILRNDKQQVVMDQELIVTTDRPSAVLLVRRSANGIRVGVPEPSREFVHNAEDWSLSMKCGTLDLEQMRALKFEVVRAEKNDVIYAPPFHQAPAPKRVAWINLECGGTSRRFQ